MKILIVVIHPDLESAVINKRWIAELKKFPDRYHIHYLHQLYPDGIIDVQKEQQLMEQYDKIVFQFPYYWFNSPWLFKKWLDEVLLHGWAYGSESGYKLAGKKIAMAISLGADEADYEPSGVYRYPLAELLRPFELSFNFVKADYRPPFAYYGIEYNSTAERIEKSVPLYMAFLNAL
ncbi:flavodoxin family protein [Pedobacter petrophilus]|uniref:Flavodoxin family protein n=1 Tax=Pedobacter petrophilus TaxID=1908241 RepID=A0A7K0FU78_9SPHI|nr:NAD(P)H-dependent oxidoreductase [Pedobacter petrophilus]MRX74499.1 flavodoxin family protein [Pedobacter petrophilus]